MSVQETTNQGPVEVTVNSEQLAAIQGNVKTVSTDTTTEQKVSYKDMTPEQKAEAAKQKLAELQAAKEQAAKDQEKLAAEAKAAKKAEQEAAKAAKKAERDAQRAAKAAEREKEKAAKKAAREAAANVPVPVLPAVEVKPPAESVMKTLKEGKASAALKAAWTSENQAELGYRQLAERYGYSVQGLIDELVAEGVWPTREGGGAWGYKKLYDAEKENGLKSWGHMVNRASERFTMYNPENIKKREQKAAEEEAKKKEEAALQAAGLVDKAKKSKGPKTVDPGMDVSQLDDVDMFNMAKACILAMSEEMRDLLCLDNEVKEALKLPE